MNRHEETETRISSWLHEHATGELPDRVLEQTFQQTRTLPQRRGRLGWLTRNTAESGNVTRGRLRMFSLTRSAAVLIVAVLATSAVLNQTQEPSTVPGAVTPAVTVEDELFTGAFNYGPPYVDDDGNEVDGMWDLQVIGFSDPRFQGQVIMTANSDELADDIYSNSFRIVTDDGAWQGDPVPGFMITSATGATSVHLLKGEGAYEGQYAVVEVKLSSGAFRVQGRIVHGEFPGF